MAETSEKKRTVGIHHLKSWPQHFEEVVKNNKSFEIRINDRDFRFGDVVIHEWDPEVVGHAGRVCDGYTGRERTGDIACVTNSHPGLRDGYVVLGIRWRL